MQSPESSGDEDELRAIPEGVVRKRKGWAGDEMEAARSLELTKRLDDDGDGDGNRVKTGDLRESFQNKEVGQGYQHSTVRRQKTGLSTTSKIVDMTSSSSHPSKPSKRKRNDSEDSDDDRITVKEMIKSREMRVFKREIARIVSQS
ncbi:hypothetical protein TrVE_jg5018 [Triparma verrucosa]|uniref:Uncharacterized protein n=2 Tax=Triparma TaxID=722752 RepID=A0A9W7EZY4_9STRA|nr:hypothetical protein TrVE_jg5018 [Triparma verrucosa]GMH96572.1 hypothetical protein TrST_g9352 [Triparma strigata]